MDLMKTVILLLILASMLWWYEVKLKIKMTGFYI